METKYLQFFNPDTGNIDDVARVGQLTKGRVVQATRFHTPDGQFSASKVPDYKYGHIAGFAKNTSNELCLVVEWETGDTHPAHPSNLILL